MEIIRKFSYQLISFVALLIFYSFYIVASVHAKSGISSAIAYPLPVRAIPKAVSSGHPHLVGALDHKQRLKLAIHLPVRNQSALDRLIKQLYDPQSPNYHHYLSVDEFTEHFGPTQADYDAVVSWAVAQGLKVTNKAKNRHLVDVEGSVETINNALHVVMSSYQHPTDSRRFFAPDREPTVNVSVPLQQITGLNNFTLPKTKLRHGSPAEVASAIAASGGGSGPGGNFIPSDMRAAYYGAGPLTGAGQTVGIFSLNGYRPDDVQLFYAKTGMVSTVPINDVLVNGYSGICDDDSGSGLGVCRDFEQVLDIVNVIGMAPGITQILFYEGGSSPDVLNQMAVDNIAKVLSCSWSSSDFENLDAIFQEFQAQGQTFVNAAGDDAAYTGDSWSPPSLNPLVLQVGGTSLTTVAAGGAWSSESAWSGSGGGFYEGAGYAIPDYQQLAGVITAESGGSTTLRNDPDVASEADLDNVLVNNGHFISGVGGTSFAAPRWAGFIALANEQAMINKKGTLGFVNPIIYSIGVGSTYAANFHDVVSGSNGFNAVAGYDLVTGWGSPKGASWIDTATSPLTAPGYVIATYPSSQDILRGSNASSEIIVSTPNGFAAELNLTVEGLPVGVTASFNPPTAKVGTNSVLTLSASNSAVVGPVSLTVHATSNENSQDATLNIFVGDHAHISVASTELNMTAVPLDTAHSTLTIENAAGSVPLTFSINAYNSIDGACTGGVSWLTISDNTGPISAGTPRTIDIYAQPSLAALSVGTYSAELCISSSDTSNSKIVLPIHLTVIPGPTHETIFDTGFEVNETSAAGIVTFVLDKLVDDSIAGSSLDLATGSYHPYTSDISTDNFSLFDYQQLSVYWLDSEGGVVNQSGSDYAILKAGAVVGPDSVFSNTIIPMASWVGGADGYIGISFINSEKNAKNYGYIHLKTAGPLGFPARILDYGFDDTGAAITVP